jgi:transposase
MPRESTISDETKDLVVELYRQGKKGRVIAAETGVSQPMIYDILARRGERPNRQKTQLQEITAAEVIEQLRAAEREAEHFKTLYEQERSVNERLMQELRGNRRSSRAS